MHGESYSKKVASTAIDPRPLSKKTATSPYEKLLELAHQRALDGKGGLAASVAEMCLASKTDLTEHELELAFDILRLLTDKVEVKIRRHIADYLAERHDVPQDLIQFLANDEITVAYPIILHSQILQESDLLELILNRTTRHRQAVAIRPGISTMITDKLVEFDEPDVLTTLLCNETADISNDSMTKLVEQSLDIDAFREPLAHRKELTPELARRMYVWVGDALREYIAVNFEIDTETIAESVDQAVDHTLAQTTPAPARTAVATPPAAKDFAHGKSLLRYLNTGDISGFEGAFADELNLSLQAMAVILYDSGLEPLAIAAKAADVDKDVFGEILCYLSGVRPAEDYKSSDEYARAMAFFEGLDHAGASAALQKWRNMPGQLSQA